jgi:hypothetical protein
MIAVHPLCKLIREKDGDVGDYLVLSKNFCVNEKTCRYDSSKGGKKEHKRGEQKSREL